MSVVELLCGGGAGPVAGFLVSRADTGADVLAYRELRRATFVDEQSLFERSDEDDWDRHPQTVVLVAREPGGRIVGGVRITPGDPDLDLAWWNGSRLVVAPDRRNGAQIGASLVRAACAAAESQGALRFEATVQADKLGFFTRLGWERLGSVTVQGRPHHWMRWPIDRIRDQVNATKAPLAACLAGLRPGGDGWVGDDAAPVPGSDLVAASDAIAPSMVERDPWWAGWCSVLVNVNDVTVKGATPVGLLDAVGAPTASHARRVLGGLADAAQAWDVPILGGHTTLGVPASLAVTALGRVGRTDRPIPGGGGRPGDAVALAADLGGGWRPGYAGHQWDSTTARTPAELRVQAGIVRRWHPAAAKDVSMAGIVGTLGMLAEASGCGARLDLAAVPRPAAAGLADWLTCFPGFAVVAAARRSASPTTPLSVTSATCGRLTPGQGIELTWPDGVAIRVLDGPVTGLGRA